MDAWQSPVRPNLRTGVITDPANGVLGGGAAPLIDGGGPGRRPRRRFGSHRRGCTWSSASRSWTRTRCATIRGQQSEDVDAAVVGGGSSAENRSAVV